MKTEPRTVGRLICFIRRQHQIKQSDLAEKLGITQSVLSEIENDKHIVTVPLLLKFAEYFSLSPSSLIPDNCSGMVEINSSNNSMESENSATNQNGSFEKERNILLELIRAKDDIIRVKDELILQLKKS